MSYKQNCTYKDGKYIAQFDEIEVEVDESLLSEKNTIVFPIRAKLIRINNKRYKLIPDRKHITYLFKQSPGIGGGCELFILNPEGVMSFQFNDYSSGKKERGLVASVRGKFPLRIEWHRDGILKDDEYPFGATIIYPDGVIETMNYKDYTEEDLEIAQSEDL